MPTPIELALTSLLPTHSFLPPTLIDLATSLLSQSRLKATHLKPDEEIGRTYACCHIACQRLGRKLALDLGRPSPPCPPKVYDKLHTYLGTVLKSAPATPRRRDGRTTPGTGRSATEATTPQTRSRGEEVKSVQASQETTTAEPTAGATTPSSRRKRKTQEQDTALPEYVMPMIRQVCTAFRIPEAAPHINAGTGSVVNSVGIITTATPSRRRKIKEGRPDDAIPTERIPALVLALYFLVSARMKGTYLKEDYDIRRDKAVAAIRHFGQNYAKDFPDLPTTDDEFNDDLEQFLLIGQESWMNMEWFSNVPEKEEVEEADSGLNEDTRDVIPSQRPPKTPLRRREKHAKRPDDGDGLGAAGLLPGLGTMFQPAVDWLSEDRVADYNQWEKDIRSQIAAVELQS